MAEPRHLAELEDAVGALLAWAESNSVPVLVIGGVAVSLLSRPRTTKDVDAVVWLPDHEDWPAFLKAGERHGLVPRIPDPIEFALRSRVLLLKHAGSGVPLDVSMGALPFEENAIRHAVPTEVGRYRVPLPTPEDLLIMKAVAHRSRDAADIESILNAHPNMDIERVLTTVREFAEALDAPEIVDDLVRLLPKSPPRKPKRTSRSRKR